MYGKNVAANIESSMMHQKVARSRNQRGQGEQISRKTHKTISPNSNMVIQIKQT